MPAIANSTWTRARRFTDKATGDALDISSYQLKLDAYIASTRQKAFTLTAGSGITISNDDDDVPSIATFEATAGQMAQFCGGGMMRVVIWRMDEERVIAEGSEAVESLSYDA